MPVYRRAFERIAYVVANVNFDGITPVRFYGWLSGVSLARLKTGLVRKLPETSRHRGFMAMGGSILEATKVPALFHNTGWKRTAYSRKLTVNQDHAFLVSIRR